MIMPGRSEFDGVSCARNEAESVANGPCMALDETDMVHKRLPPRAELPAFALRNQAYELHAGVVRRGQIERELSEQRAATGKFPSHRHLMFTIPIHRPHNSVPTPSVRHVRRGAIRLVSVRPKQPARYPTKRRGQYYLGVINCRAPLLVQHLDETF